MSGRLVSIVIPTCNEEADIRRSLEAVIGLCYERKEIIVVDDSTDKTPMIVTEYVESGVRLIKRSKNRNGCCGARNYGILEAKGEIVVLLNADVIPPVDFIDKIMCHYETGADYVLVESRVANDGKFFARFVDAHGHWSYEGNDLIEWTEGFSCRRQAAIEVGLIAGDYPLNFCRDWRLGDRLGRNGYRKVIDRTIVVQHIAPETLSEYWRVRQARGRFAAMSRFFIEKVTFGRLVIETLLKTAITVAEMITLVPLCIKCGQIATHSPRRARDIGPFMWAYGVQGIALRLGEWRGCRQIRRYKSGRKVLGEV